MVAMQTLILNSVDLQRIVSHVGIDDLMDETIRRLREAFVGFDPKSCITPQRTGFHYSSPPGLIEWMPLFQRGSKVLMKLVGYHPECPTRHGTPTIVSTISIYDTSTGHLTSILDGTFATAIRTGAASAIASEWLAHQDSRVLGLVGCGAQAITQLHALSRLFEFERVLVYDVDSNVATSMMARATSFENCLDVEVTSLQEIRTNADIICTATSVQINSGPVITLTGCKPHLHVNAVGSDFPGKTELERDFLLQSLVCPDFPAQAEVEGECQQLASPDQMGPSITDVAKSPGSYRQHKARTTVFDSTGWALEDWVAAELFVEKANELGFGQHTEIEYLPSDPRNPYDFLVPAKLPV